MSALPPLAVALATLSSRCAVEEYRNADLQLDVSGLVTTGARDETRVRICVEGVGNAEEALGAGRVPFVGLPPDQAAVITVDTLSDSVEETRQGRVGPVTLDGDTPYAEAAWVACDADCGACAASGAVVAEGEPDWLLGVRFLD